MRHFLLNGPGPLVYPLVVTGLSVFAGALLVFGLTGIEVMSWTALAMALLSFWVNRD